MAFIFVICFVFVARLYTLTRKRLDVYFRLGSLLATSSVCVVSKGQGQRHRVIRCIERTE